MPKNLLTRIVLLLIFPFCAHAQEISFDLLAPGDDFLNPVINESAYFDSAVDYRMAHFHSIASFARSEFHQPVDFIHTQFDSLSVFDHAHFFTYNDFVWARFGKESSFFTSRFDSTAVFVSAQFNSRADFAYSYFGSAANFTGTEFDKDVFFNNVYFAHTLMLVNIHATTNTAFFFFSAHLPDTIDLSHNQDLFNGAPKTIDLTLADFTDTTVKHKEENSWQKAVSAVKHYFYPFDTTGDYKKHWINLYCTDISKIKIDYGDFRFYAAESYDNGPAKTKSSPEVPESIYEGLLKNFKDRGQKDSYEKLDIKYQRYLAHLKPGDFSVLDWWWRYGYDKGRVFIHTPLFILLFTIINFFFLHLFNDENNGVYHIDNIPSFGKYKFGVSIRRSPGFLKRCWYSFIYTCIIFFLLSLKIEKVKFSKLASVWIMVVYVVGLICMGFIANLILQK